MLRFIWSNWWRHKERFLIMLVGVFIVSAGLSFLFGLNESNKGTVMETLENKWKVSYDILVRPQGTQATDEANRMFEPNFQDGITGGISREQLQRIKAIPGVSVAAPLAVIGYTEYSMPLNQSFKFKEHGVYRWKVQTTTNNGVQHQTSVPFSSYYNYDLADDPEFKLSTYDTTLLVGIDPVEEAKLVGLDKAVLSSYTSRYFNGTDSSKVYNLDQLYGGSYRAVDVPILMSNRPFTDKKYTFEFEKLDVPFETEAEVAETRTKIKANGGLRYLDQFNTQTYTYQDKEVDANERLAEKFKMSQTDPDILPLVQKATPLTFKSTKSPFSNRWPYTYQLQTYTDPALTLAERFPDYYRPYERFVDAQHPDAVYRNILRATYIGLYDPTKLQVSKDLEHLFPMDTYTAPSAKFVFDSKGRPANPQSTIKPVNNPLGFLTSPPTMLTTLEAASMLSGDKPISVIRIKAAGINEVSDANQAKLEQIAAAIEQQTGLQTDIMMGSSPQPVLIQVPESGTQSAIGWMEQMWIKLGAALSIVSEVKLGFSGMLLLVIGVSMIYVAATNMVSFLVRKKQFAIMLSIGWRKSNLRRLLLMESMLIGVFVALVTWTMESYFILARGSELSLSRFLFIGGCGFVIYMLGVIAPILQVGRIKPMEALRTGEYMASTRRMMPVRHLVQLAAAHFHGKMKRNWLSVLAMAVPTMLLMFFVFVTIRLKGVFYTSWLGQYAAAEIGSMHYIAIGICLLIAALTTAEIVWQNVSERKPEIALLKALGWRNRSIRQLIWYEGMITGIVAGLLAFVLGVMFIALLYRKVPVDELWYLLMVGVVPVLTGLLGSILPAEMAVALSPVEGMKGSYTTAKQTEARLKKIIMAVAMVTLLVAAASIGRLVMLDLGRETPSVEANVVITADPHGEVEVGKLEGYTPKFVENGSRASYDLQLRMNDQAKFSVEAAIEVNNQSGEEWDELVFYMIPHVFSDKSDSQLYRASARFEIGGITVNGESTSFTLEGDKLSVPLMKPLLPADHAKVEVTYSFQVPEHGIRYTNSGASYYLAQWYPMLATYQGGWNKQPYTPLSESYHTGFSDFTLHYDLPSGYRVISSSDEDATVASDSGDVRLSHAKELMVTVAKELTFVETKVDGVDLRVWGSGKWKEQAEEALPIITKAFQYFEQHISKYPYKQLDVMFDNVSSMEYPGIVTVDSDADKEKHTLVHELAHQWFYNVVSNDPYVDGWLDEGMAELSTAYYLDDFSFDERFYRAGSKRSNLPLSAYESRDIIQSLYAQPAMKMRELFDRYGGKDAGVTFLHAYYEKYQNQQVDTKEFVRFAVAYFSLQDDSFFRDWLQLE
ncbi:FtsX-like permease family protein [Paenibacillus sp. CF384]|uniref:FtsX-like permease family protein n=1 Tax=Paenibacillus sp. CF384 TaxID=1884382 RepID=UPI000898DBFE|nr:FtsX-like permease family protein [Paenibacillus sp. CF384]SDX80226.1 FtsX-like permease family protein [Paenibacillus sp. CF384]